MEAAEFVERWRNTELGERQSYQAHFMDLCHLVGYETPTGTGKDSQGNDFVFEPSLKKQSGGQGFADVYLQKHFAFEYKAANKYKDLRAAYDQLLQYREQLQNPPLLVVTDIQNWEIHTNWPNTEKKIYSFKHDEIASRSVVRDYLRHLFYDPQKLHPRRNSEQVTKDAAKAFEIIANNMRDWQAEPQRIANFLTKLVFCLFAEDVSLLPSGPKGDAGIFSEIIEQTRLDTSRFVRYTQDLFKAMADGGDVLFQRIPYFNGSLFVDINVEELAFEALSELEKASRLNWESVEPSIFGTLFERSLDPAKRSYLGAHYTSREDILLIVEPVLMRPLEQQWEAIKEKAVPIRTKYDEALATSNRRNQTNFAKELEDLRGEMLKSLREIKVLDPACGSGNFLYVALQRLMDMEKEVLLHPLFEGLLRLEPKVHPDQLYGIEKDAIAHALASIVVWIGYLQWRRTNGYLNKPAEPILQDIHENIQNMDAILAYDESGNPCDPEWPAVDVIVGNPPFLGGYKVRGELGDNYTKHLWKLYEGRVGGGADLVTYWFEKARTHIDLGKAKRVGLLATNSIRQAVNRGVLERIKKSGDIFMAWADREWVLEGAAVRVSLVGFDNGKETFRLLDNKVVSAINSDLTARLDTTKAAILVENADVCFMGPSAKGPFEFDRKIAISMLNAQNPSGKNNADVVKPVLNAADLVKNPRMLWTIDFALMSEEEAMTYEMPYAYLKQHVYPLRSKNRRESYAKYWWRYAEARPGMRQAMEGKKRYIATPAVSKHRIFVWVSPDVMANQRNLVFVRDDDYFFGVLHSKLHEIWALRQGSTLEDRPAYTPTTTFETFPLPFAPASEDVTSFAYQAVASAAKQLHEERHEWLNPSNTSNSQLKERTITTLYNALNVFRGKEKMKVKAIAGDFAPRLDELHTALDKAVCDAYGWPHEILQDEEAILSRLLTLNLERAQTNS